jgi:hypothetical protein
VARPTFHVQHFVACLNAPWEGVPGPDTLRTLEGVSYRYTVAPMEEPPFVREQFWLYARMFRVNNVEGVCRFVTRLVWVDAPGGERSVRAFRIGSIRFTDSHPVQSTAWSVGPVHFPGLGRYEFRLFLRLRTKWGRRYLRPVAVEHVVLERGS